MVRWVVDVDLAELFVPFQRSHDSTVRKDVIDRKATKVQFDSGVRVGHGSGIGYDLQKSEVTLSPTSASWFNAPQRGSTSPVSCVRTLVVHGLGLAISPIVGTVIPMTFPCTVLSVANDPSGPDMSMNKAANMIGK